MNYIREINAFECRMQRQPLPITAQLLWYKLMAFANRQHWPEWFSVDNERLTELLSAASDRTVRSARAQLEDAGYIQYRKGVKGKPSHYKLNSVDEMESGGDATALEEPSESAIPEDFKDDITRYYGYTEQFHLEIKRITQELFEAYLPSQRPTQQYELTVFHFVTSSTGNGEQEMVVDKDKRDLLAYAFDAAQRAGAVNWNYIKGVLRNLQGWGLKNLNEVYDHEDKRDQRIGRL